MSVSSFSQDLFPVKTVYRGINAVIISEAQMDTISVRLIDRKRTQAMLYALSVEIDSLVTANEKYALKIDYLTSDNKNLNEIIGKTDLRLEAQKGKYEAEVDYYKARAKKWLYNVLMGTGIGMLLMGIIAL